MHPEKEPIWTASLRSHAKWSAFLYMIPILVFLIIGIITGHRMVLIGGVLALIGNIGYFVAMMRDTRDDP